jgi:glycerophosphoryl diester phosphodiesterase
MESSTVKHWPYPTLFAHRGGGTLAPENTLAAVKMGNAHSFVAVEFDVKLSRDNVVLLMHDASLERTTNGVGLVAEKSIQELETLDAGAWHSAQYLGERIPRLSVLSKYLHWMGIMANIEIKPCPGREVDTGRIVAEMCDELWKDRLVKPLISSFSIDALRAARIAAPALPIGLLVEIPEQGNLALLAELGAVSLHCNQEHITPVLVSLFHLHGYRVMTYTVNEPARVTALLEMGVDGIFTDSLHVMEKHFPGQLSDAGKPMRNPLAPGFTWPTIVPPIG